MTESTQPHTHPNGPAPSAFSQLIIMLATTALQQLGVIPDQGGQPPEVHLESAQGMIDLIEMLDLKTKGNLEVEEKKMLVETLTMLRFHYVEVSQGAAKKAPDAPPPAAQKSPSASAEQPADQATDSTIIESSPGSRKDDEDKTRYRKSYG